MGSLRYINEYPLHCQSPGALVYMIVNEFAQFVYLCVLQQFGTQNSCLLFQEPSKDGNQSNASQKATSSSKSSSSSHGTTQSHSQPPAQSHGECPCIQIKAASLC